jgi:hypothetical protein
MLGDIPSPWHYVYQESCPQPSYTTKTKPRNSDTGSEEQPSGRQEEAGWERCRRGGVRGLLRCTIAVGLSVGVVSFVGRSCVSTKDLTAQ